MSGFTVSSSSSQNVYNFSQLALQSVNQFRGDEKSWARHYARQFYHTVSVKPGFLPVYNALLNALKTLNEEKKKEEVSKKNEEKTSTTKKVNKNEKTTSNKKPFDIEADIKDALEHIDDFSNEKEWARAYARQLFHNLEGKTPFIDLYNLFMNRFEKEFDEEFQEDNISIESEENEDDEEYLPYNHQKKKKTSSNTFAKDGDQTDSERKQGKYMLNKVLCKEYNDWYDAFQEEAKEELQFVKNNGESNIPTGDQRWIHHSSKLLFRKTSIPIETIKPVVEAWLMERNH
jgi:hypothetical protein